MKKVGVIITALLLVGIFMAAFIPAASAGAGSQTWWFKQENRVPAVTGPAYTACMIKNYTGEESNKDDGYNITAQGVCFVADKQASVNVSFTGKWTGIIEYSHYSLLGNATVILTLGYVDGANFIPAVSGSQTVTFISPGDNPKSVSIIHSVINKFV